MSFLNRSRPTSGIVALVGAIVGLPSLGTLVYTEVQKIRTSTSEVAACNNAEYQLKQTDLGGGIGELRKEYLVVCSPSVQEEKREHDYYLASAPYWASIAFMSLSVAGIGLTINRRKEE